MAHDGDQGTDARPIKPVSSLLSHFEGLKPQIPPSRQQNQSPHPIRASCDLPRPDSPWTSSTDPIRGQPQTPRSGQRREGESPTRSGHKRPMSMHITSSPQLTPAVHVESPKSPPRSFFYRGSSRSPERSDNTPFGKVRDLISAHSSRPSTRAPSPSPPTESDTIVKGAELGRGLSKDNASPDRSASPTRRAPPPVNRADKPKIPAKPPQISQTVPITGRLTPEPPPPASDARVSPFSTPPSSDGLPSPEDPAEPDFPQDRDDARKEADISTTRDARHMGFQSVGIPSRANTVAERKTARDTSTAKRYVSEQHFPPPAPLPQSVRDPRQLGFSNGPSRPEQVVPERAPLVQPRPQPPPISTYIRDARVMGFSNSPVRNTPIHEDRPDLPARRPVQAPPPRPSEESKNPPPKKPVQQPMRQVSKPDVAITGDFHFPPPPKRKTFDEGLVTVPQSAESRADPSVTRPKNDVSFSEKNDREVSYANDTYDSDEAESAPEPKAVRSEYPDASQVNRRPPFNLSGSFEIKSRSDGRMFDTCGKYLCVSGYTTRVFDMSTGEQVFGINHGETVKISSVRFKPSARIGGEAKRVWLGSNIGDLHELDIETRSIVATSQAHKTRDVIKILRRRQDMWTIDDDGKLLVWKADTESGPNLRYGHTTHRIPRGHTFSMVVHDQLWLATGREVRIYTPGNEVTFSAVTSPLAQPNVGDVTSGAYSNEHGGRVYFGHADGKVTIYSTTDYSFIGLIKASDYKISGLSFVGDQLWAAYKTGKVYVYDTSCTPWKVKKDWRAHTGPVSGMLLDPSSVWTLSQLQIVTSGHDDVVRIWDATLEEDWMESVMQERDAEFCTFREVRAAVVTWNVGAASPLMLRSDFIADAIHAEDPPEILAFGFQEVVDLEDKAITAKSILGFGKKKDTAKYEQHQSGVYREWRDYLARTIDRSTNRQYSYSEIQTSSLVGLFQCVFIQHGERHRVSNLSAANVKCGLGGHLGNKGCLITRFVLDDSSLCFVNCHLAAGQTHTSHRNNDVATILESENLQAELNRSLRSSLFVGGGDGTQILDHEICIINGDLNYRIDTVPRDTVIRTIRSNDFSKLLNRDQLLICRRRIAGFRLAPFSEMPITFAPTYKYDVGTDNYDSSEKKRAPAWCDRVLYRGPGRIKQLEYRRHEVRVSDHRPVSGMFKIRIKRVDPTKQDRVRQECFKKFQTVKKQICEAVCIGWLVEAMGVSSSEAKRLIAG